MRSLKRKFTLFSVISVAASIITCTAVGAISVAAFSHKEIENDLSLLCTTGKNNLNYYLKSVEQSINTVSSIVDSYLDQVDETTYTTNFGKHIEDVKFIFNEFALNTNGVFTYYYRIDPDETAINGQKGFWYADLHGNGFEEQTVTDISDRNNECVWFYTPKKTGKPIWLPPYVTDNLDVYVISYNAPVYRNGHFIGVVGIEINYKTLGDQIKNIKALSSGYAFIIENEHGSIVYHPTIDILSMPVEERPQIPPKFVKAFKEGKDHIVYTFQGVKKHSFNLPLSNGMSVVVCVPEGEINNVWGAVVSREIIAAVILIAAAVAFTLLLSSRFTKPLEELTLAAEEINKGNYDVKIDYKGDDEIGVLSTTVNKFIRHLDDYINDLNSLAYADALTEVSNRSAFEEAMNELQKEIDSNEKVEFAIALFDCDNLKTINDTYGHDKGNIYLKNSCNLIGRIFNKSKIYRIGGDEFVAILQGEDYNNREELKRHFLKKSDEIRSFTKQAWEKISVSVGIAVYDASLDKTIEDVLVHADHLMYTNKRERKKSIKNEK